MWAWWRGTQLVRTRVAKLAVSVPNFVRMMRGSSVNVIPGTAFFLTGDPDVVPSALLHNIKHNRVLHEQTVLLTVETLRVPYATAEERASVTPLGGCFVRLTLRFGFMETPNVSRAMDHARGGGAEVRRDGLDLLPGAQAGSCDGARAGAGDGQALRGAQPNGGGPDGLLPLPRDRVVELGERVAI